MRRTKGTASHLPIDKGGGVVKDISTALLQNQIHSHRELACYHILLAIRPLLSTNKHVGIYPRVPLNFGGHWDLPSTTTVSYCGHWDLHNTTIVFYWWRMRTAQYSVLLGALIVTLFISALL